MARKTAIGIQDFSKIIENNCFYVDKTDFIKEWWENMDDVTLITRPRRFGKTLAMSMTEHFFSVNHTGKGDLFEGLKIWKEAGYRELQGTYPVIFLSFAGIKEAAYGSACRELRRLIVREYRKHAFLAESASLLQAEREEYLNIMAGGLRIEDLGSSINLLSEYLYRYYDRKVIILLDEYDTPMQEAYVNGFWDEMVSFMRGFFNATFKTNPYLERGLMTGITRVSKESIFSDLNNLEVVTTTSVKYQEAFGFTEKEVFLALDEFGLQEEGQKVKEWYDGFRFGDCGSIYNPWSVIQFLDKKKYAPYWANTSSNSLIGKLIRQGSPDIKKAVEDLIRGDSFTAYIDEEIVFSELDRSPDAVWSLLLAGGYLKIAGMHAADCDPDGMMSRYELVLTNREIRYVFSRMIRGWFAGCSGYYNDFEKALLAGSVREMNIYMNKISFYTFSSFDAGKRPSEAAEPERFYHGFVLGLLVDLQKRYEITSNRESGYGRYDVMLCPLDRDSDGIILEFKVTDPGSGEGSLADTADAAVRQIIDKGYAAALESRGADRGSIRIYGFAFSGKEVLIDGGYLSRYESCSYFSRVVNAH